MIRKNALVKLADGRLGKIFHVTRYTNTLSMTGFSYSERGISSVNVKLLSGQDVVIKDDDVKGLESLTKTDLDIDTYTKLKGL